jgi:hypothetical protein
MKASLTKMHSLTLVLLLLTGLGGCVGIQTFTTAARPGDTVSLAVGRHELSRQNLTVTITPASGSPIVYAPNDPRIRSIANLYPDPVSNLIIGVATGQDMWNGEVTTGQNIRTYVTAERDWWQTFIVLDLPATLPTGTATIAITDAAGAQINPASIDILPEAGASNGFDVYGFGGIVPKSVSGSLKSMERAPHYTVYVVDCSVTDPTYGCIGTNIPNSIQIEFSRTPGVGVLWVANPRGDIKNINWAGLGGGKFRVMLTTVNGGNPTYLTDFKFYVAGGITGLTATSVRAYDINGYLLSNFSAVIQ